jgi:hypothetical protein
MARSRECRRVNLDRPKQLLLARILRACYSSNFRGRTRVMLLIARKVKALQTVPIN